MPRAKKTAAELIAELEQREAQLKARRHKIKARITGQERKDDTRRKVIAGALALEHGRKDGDFSRKLDALISEYVVTDKERALFGLDPLPKS